MFKILWEVLNLLASGLLIAGGIIIAGVYINGIKIAINAVSQKKQ